MRASTWTWGTVGLLLVAVSVGAVAHATPIVCADLLVHEEVVECYLSDLAAGQLAVTGAASFLADAGPTIGVLGAAMVALLLTRWPHG